MDFNFVKFLYKTIARLEIAKIEISQNGQFPTPAIDAEIAHILRSIDLILAPFKDTAHY